MRALARAALVIARRDYAATVFSRAFLLFLFGPLLPVAFAVLFATVGAPSNRPPAPRAVAVVASATDGTALLAARDRLARRLGDDALPPLRLLPPAAGHDAARLLGRGEDAPRAILTLAPGGPRLAGAPRDLGPLEGSLALILDEAGQARLLADAGIRPAPAVLATRPLAPAPGGPIDRRPIAQVAQLALVMLTMILAGMLLSNVVEEKSNKVIEVLAAAVPVDAIFLGKLVAMLAMSLTGILVWGSMAAIGLSIYGAASALSPAALLPPPAVGWPLFALLLLCYFCACYLLVGAVFLGIGSQAQTVREVQTLSMPVTMGQLVIFALASTAVNEPDGTLAGAAAVFPWSSPFVMIARAGQFPAVWPHVVALVWQALWIGLIIRFAARRFRSHVLNGTARRPTRRYMRWRHDREG